MLLRDVMSAGSERPQVSSPERGSPDGFEGSNLSLPDAKNAVMHTSARGHVISGRADDPAAFRLLIEGHLPTLTSHRRTCALCDTGLDASRGGAEPRRSAITSLEL
jgi:hypothetical protein